MMKQMMLVAVALVVAAFTNVMVGEVASAADPKTQIDILRKQAAEATKGHLEDLGSLRTEVNKMKRRLGGLTAFDKKLTDETLPALEKRITDLEQKLKNLKSPNLTKIRTDINVLQGDVYDLWDAIYKLQDDVKELQELYPEIKLGIRSSYGTSGLLNVQAEAAFELHLDATVSLELAGAVGGNHEGASAAARVLLNFYTSKSFSIGIGIGIDANGKGGATYLTTEMWGGALQFQKIFDDHWYSQILGLAGSEWQKQAPTVVGRVIYSNDAREFGFSVAITFGYKWGGPDTDDPADEDYDDVKDADPKEEGGEMM